MTIPEPSRQRAAGRSENSADDPRDSTLHEQLETRMRETPEAVALQLGPSHLTNRDLGERQSELVWDPRSLDVGPERKPSAAAPAPLPRAGSFPLSFAQSRMWFLDQLEPENPFYNSAIVRRLRGRLDVRALEHALGELVRRHEVLRTTFPVPQGQVEQRVAQEMPPAFEVIDLTALPAHEREAQAGRLVAERSSLPFDLASGPLLRASVVKLGKDDHVVLLSVHHIVFDGWSSGIIARELAAHYGARVTGAPADLPALPVQYADFAVWQRDFLRGRELERQLSYWSQQLSGLPTLQLPTDRLRPAVQTFVGAREMLVFPRELAEKLEVLARNERATLSMALLAAFKILLHRYTRQTDVVVGSPIAGRVRREIEELVGCFINTLVLRTDVSGDPTFRELLRRVREVSVGAYEHQDLPFEKIVEELGPERDLSRNPLFQVLFTFQDAPGVDWLLPGIDAEVLEIDSRSTLVDLDLSMWVDATALKVRIDYNTDLFDGSTIRRMGRHLQRLIEAIVVDPAQRISRLPLLSDDERKELLGLSDGEEDRPRDAGDGRPVHELFEERVWREPTSVAVEHEGRQLTYLELNERANRLARRLRDRGVGPGVLVGISLERSAELIVGILAILKAGGAYVPLDPEWPRRRMEFVVRETRLAVLVTSKRFLDALHDLGPDALCIDANDPASKPGQDLESLAGPRDLAYVMYTSGSTGHPKGVAVQHGALGNYVGWAVKAYTSPESRDFPLFTSVAFDLTVTSLYVPLACGGRIVIYGESGTESDLAILRVLEEDRVDVVKLTPSHLALVSGRGFASKRLKTLIVGGEDLKTDLAASVTAAFGDVTVYNEYGPTEATVGCMAHRFDRDVDDGASVPIGTPIESARAYILDEALQPVPVGVTGEVYVSGAGLARDYLNRPDLTAERFTAEPFRPGERMYRTGDLARWRADGVAVFLGREDHQLKIRGFRIEIEEIEAALAQHDAVRACVVALRGTGSDGARLVAYVVPEAGAPRDIEPLLRDDLRRKIPKQMVPSAFVVLDQLPLTSNGKVDVHSLPEPTTRRSPVSYVAPRTPAEEALAAIWADVLEVDRVGVTDNFFELGGHSLLATRVVGRIREHLEVELPLIDIFERPTISELAIAVQDAKNSTAAPSAPAARAADAPLSFSQQRMWFLDRLEPASPFYNIPMALRLEGRLDPRALEDALRDLIRRHETLRTTLHWRGTDVVQVIDGDARLELPVVGVEGLAGKARDDEVRRLIDQEVRLPFDLERGPLLRAGLLRLAEREHVLLLTFHHIIFDGWSFGVLTRDLSALYKARLSGETASLPELPVQYADFAARQRERLQGPELERQLGYWKRALEGLPTLQLPTDRPRPATQSYRGARETLVLPLELRKAIETLARGESATLSMALLAAFNVLLHRYTRQEDIVVGSPIAGRSHLETEELIGCFINTLVLRADLSGDPSYLDLFRRVREVALGAYEHQDLPFEKLVEELQPERDLARNPLFQVLFSFESASRIRWDLPGLASSPIQLDARTTHLDLEVTVTELEDGLRVRCAYATDLFDAETIRRLLGHFERLLEGIVADPERRISELPLLGEEERRLVLEEWNDTAAERPRDATIHGLLTAQAERMPEAVALRHGTEQLTYRELHARSSQLARYLRERGVGPEVLVGIAAERGIDMVVALLGVLKAGGAYVPLDPEYPRERLELMLRDSGAPVLLTQSHLLERLPAGAEHVVCLDRDRDAISRQSAESFPAAATSENLAYVIYTSGSTGTPKGVAIEHRSACALLAWAGGVFAPEELAGVLFSTSICFDLSVFELFAPLSRGGTVIVAENALQLPSLAPDHAVTLVNTVPSAMAELLRSGHLPDSVRTVNLAGEKLTVELVRRIYEEPSVERVYDLFGPSEDTTYSTFALRTADGPYTVGRPIDNTQVYLLDAKMNPVPLGVPGEMYLGGDGLARGYLHRPELTAEKFVAHPFSDAPGARLYRSGDLARYLPDGNIEFLGRLDHQVKVRGFRIELGEIETVLRHHEKVEQAVVLLREDRVGDPRLTAYFTSEDGRDVPASDLRQWLGSHLPAYMVPSSFLRLDAMPLTLNGKIDRKALPAPEVGAIPAAGAHVAPRTETEEALAAIWADVLEVEQVGVTDNFFELGGHSLLATRVIGRIRENLDVELPLTEIFEHPTISELAASIRTVGHQDAAEVEAPLIGPGARGVDPPLSFSQRRMWFLDQLEPASPFYNIPLALRLEGQLDPRSLEEALRDLVQRHETLRTTLRSRGTDVMQVIGDGARVDLALVDVSGLAGKDREDDVRRRIDEEARRPFDLERGPLLRAGLLRLAEREHVLLLTFHHIIFDGWSYDVLMRDLSALYKARLNGETASLPELPIQYADFAIWQRERLRGAELERQLGYWKRALEGLPALQLPTDRPRPASQSYRGARETLVLAPRLRTDLETLARSESATLSMTLLAAFNVLLHRYTQQVDIVVGSPIAGRGQRETEGLIGCLINTLVLRNDLSGSPSFRELLGRVRKVSLGAYEHQDLPFEKLVEELQPERDLARNPLFQVLFSFRGASKARWELPGLAACSMDVNVRTTHLDLEVSVSDGGKRLAIGCGYATDLFDGETIRRLLGHFERLLEGIAADPEQSISELPLLGEEERRLMLEEWNDTAVELPQDATVPELFAAQAKRTPEAVALQHGTEQLTYRELEARSSRLARYLRDGGVGPEVLVGIATERGIDMVVGLLGILKAGGAYVPLDPEYPRERLELMLRDSGAPVLITQSHLLDRLPADAGELICLDRDWSIIDKESDAALPAAASADNLAYVIFTSGSTGRPKGVQIEHRSLSSLLFSMRREPGLRQEDTLLAVTTLSFDIAALELFLPLITGARVVLAARDVAADGVALDGLLRESGATVLQATPATWRMLLRSGWKPSSRLKMLCGGEELPPSLARRLLSTEGELWNLYGPTETTIWSTLTRIRRRDSGVSIGRPIAGTRIYILDGHGEPVPVGVPGELHIAGAGLARGYLNRPELTRERFVDSRLPEEPGGRLYRTGDLARYLPDGRIEHLGRVDLQVKVRGFRIELGEIEATLESHEQVEQAVVTTRRTKSGEQSLVAYVLTRAETPPTRRDLRRLALDRLPSYMVPAEFHVTDALPLTPNGKVDRHAVARLATAWTRRVETGSPHVPPRTAIEKQLAELWQDVLAARSIGVKDNFFEIGGNSIEAAILFSKIESALGIRLPLATLFRASTIEELAELIEGDVDATSWASLVPIQPNGSRPRLFCIHGAGGNVLLYRRLAHHLGPDQPVYGLQSRGLDGREPPLGRIEDMAARYVREVKAMQPEGPYFLAGYCMGGTIAYEMARQLLARGDTVGLLAFFETYNPRRVERERKRSRRIRVLLQNVRFHLKNTSLLGPKEKMLFVREKAGVARRRIWRALRAKVRHIFDSAKADAGTSAFPLPLTKINDRANADYEPLPYGGDVLLFRPNASFVGQEDPDFGWRDLVGGELETVVLPVYPRGMLTEPFVRTLAARLRERIRGKTSTNVP